MQTLPKVSRVGNNRVEIFLGGNTYVTFCIWRDAVVVESRQGTSAPPFLFRKAKKMATAILKEQKARSVAKKQQHVFDF